MKVRSAESQSPHVAPASLPVLACHSPCVCWGHLLLLALQFAWELLSASIRLRGCLSQVLGDTASTGPSAPCCSGLPPIPSPSWLEGHSCPPTWVLFQGAPDPGEGSAPSCPHDYDDYDVLRTRRARHARKRRRLV